MKEFQTANFIIQAATEKVSAEEIFFMLPEEVKPKNDSTMYCLDIMDITDAFGLPLTLCFRSQEEMTAARLLLHKTRTNPYKIVFVNHNAYCSAT